MTLSYENINLSTDQKFNCDIDISRLLDGDLDKLFASDDNCKRDIKAFQERITSEFGTMNDYNLSYKLDTNTMITFNKPRLDIDTSKLGLYISRLLSRDKKYDSLKKECIIILNKNYGQEIYKVVSGTNPLTIEYLKPISREIKLFLTELYIKGLLKIFLSNGIVNYVKNNGDEFYNKYKKALFDKIGSVDSIYTKVSKLVGYSTITFPTDGTAPEIFYYGTPKKPTAFGTTSGYINIAESAGYMAYHQFLYDVLDIAFNLGGEGFLPPNYFYNKDQYISIEPVEIKLPTTMTGQKLEMKAEKINADSQSIIDTQYKNEIEEQVNNLKKKLADIGTDSSIALKLSTDINILKEKLNKTPSVEEQAKMQEQIKLLTDRLKIENEANKAKADSVEKDLFDTKKQLEEQIKIENANKQELKNTIDSLKNELKSNTELNSNQKNALDSQISNLKAQLEQEELNDTEDKKMLQSRFDLLKSELDQTKEALKAQENDSFMEKYGITVIIVISIILLLILALVGYLIIKK